MKQFATGVEGPAHERFFSCAAQIDEEELFYLMARGIPREQAQEYIRRISAPFGPHSEAQWRVLTETWLRRNADGMQEQSEQRHRRL